MKHVRRLSIPLLSFAVVFLFCLPSGMAYETYYNGSSGNCASCHGNFYSNYHSFHISGSDPITSKCNLCHTGSSYGFTLTMWSGIGGGTGKGCTGCHGRDYGETIGANYGGFPTAGKAKSSGYGLRKFHVNIGYSVCNNCHSDPAQADILPEYVNPPYYSRNDVSVGGESMYACDNEDTGNDGNSEGLDNDGDLAYDADDSDCSLTFDSHEIDDDLGGTINFALKAGMDNANRNYFILASATGTDPGTLLPGGLATLPLNWDIFTDLALELSIYGNPIFTNFIGNLDLRGEATAQFNLPPAPGFSGTVIHFAFCLGWPWEFVSNPNPVELVP